MSKRWIENLPTPTYPSSKQVTNFRRNRKQPILLQEFKTLLQLFGKVEEELSEETIYPSLAKSSNQKHNHITILFFLLMMLLFLLLFLLLQKILYHLITFSKATILIPSNLHLHLFRLHGSIITHLFPNYVISVTSASTENKLSV